MGEDSFLRFPDLGLFNCVPLLLSLGQAFWGLLNVFLVSTFLGASPLLLLPSISTNPDLLPTWLEVSLVIHVLLLLLLQLLHIGPAFPSIPSPLLPMPTIRRLKFVEKKPINVSLVVLDGWRIRHNPTFQLFTPFWPLTVTSQQLAI